jgi:hypothetical protein
MVQKDGKHQHPDNNWDHKAYHQIGAPSVLAFAFGQSLRRRPACLGLSFCLAACLAQHGDK